MIVPVALRRLSVVALVAMAASSAHAQADFSKRFIDAQIKVRNGQVAEAIVVYEELFRENPANEPLIRGYSGALRQQGRYEEALRVLARGDEALRSPRFILQRVSLLEQLRRRPEALRLCLEHLGEPVFHHRLHDKVLSLTEDPLLWKTAYDALRERFADDPTPGVGQTLVELCLAEDRYDEAVASAKKMEAALDSGGEHLRSLARRLERLEQTELALDLVEEALRVPAPGDPSRGQTVVFRADLQEKLGRPHEAYEGLTSFAASNRDLRAMFDVHMRRARLLSDELGESMQAVAILDSLLEWPTLRPNHDDIRLYRAETQLRTGAFEGALADFHALSMGSRKETVRERAEFMVGEVFFYQGEIDSAAAAYLDQVQRFPDGELANDGLERIFLFNDNYGDTGEALRNYGKVALLERKNRPEEAITLADSLALRHAEEPIHDDFLFLTARLAAESEAPDRAIPYLDRLVAVHADSKLAPRALQLKGEILETKLARPAAALPVYERLLIEHPFSVEAEEVRPRVTRLRMEQQS